MKALIVVAFSATTSFYPFPHVYHFNSQQWRRSFSTRPSLFPSEVQVKTKTNNGIIYTKPESQQGQPVYNVVSRTTWRMHQKSSSSSSSSSSPEQKIHAEESSLPDFNEVLDKDWGELNDALESSDFGKEIVIEDKSLRRRFVEENEGSGGFFTHAFDEDGNNKSTKRKGGRKKQHILVKNDNDDNDDNNNSNEDKEQEISSKPRLNKLGGRPMMVPKRDIEKLKREPVWYKEPKWFFLQTRPGFEHNVAISVKNAANNLSTLKVFDVVIPQTKTMRLSKSGRAVKKDERIFPGYMMINMIMDKKSYNDIRSIPNCQGFMNDPNRDKSKKQPIRPPLPAGDAEVASVFAKLREQEIGDPKEKFKLRPGDWVDVIVEPYKDKRGKVMQVKPDMGIVVTRLVMYGHYTQVELQYSDIEPVSHSEIDPKTGNPYVSSETGKREEQTTVKDDGLNDSNEEREQKLDTEKELEAFGDRQSLHEDQHHGTQIHGHVAKYAVGKSMRERKKTIAEKVASVASKMESSRKKSAGTGSLSNRESGEDRKDISTGDDVLSSEEQGAALDNLTDDDFTEADLDFWEESSDTTDSK